MLIIILSSSIISRLCCSLHCSFVLGGHNHIVSLFRFDSRLHSCITLSLTLLIALACHAFSALLQPERASTCI